MLLIAEQLRRRVPGGIGTYIRGLVWGLASMGEASPAVTLWASRSPRGEPDPLAPLGRLVTSPLGGRLMGWAWDHGFAPGAGPPALDPRQRVHATSLATPPDRSGRLSVMVHDLAWRRHPETFGPRGRRWHEAALGRALQRGRLLVVPSRATADDLVAGGADAAAVEIVEHGCDHLAGPDDAAADALLAELGVAGRYLLTVSTLEPRKNLVRLCAAHVAARPRYPEPWPLLVVGPSGWGPALVAEPGVVPAGPVPAATLSALYRRAVAVAYVPLWEGYGLPAVEAMASGVPVVASPMPSTDGAALEVDPGDIDEMSRALARVAGDEALRAELIEAGLRRTAPLTWERCARRHTELWASMR